MGAKKRPASSASQMRKRLAEFSIGQRPSCKEPVERIMIKKPATRAVSKKSCQKEVATSSRTTCKPVAEMTTSDFLFFEVPGPWGDLEILGGCKSPREGYLFKHIDFNRFEDTETKIPENARKVHPPDGWIKRRFWDPAQRRIWADPTAMPKTAKGTAYAIEDHNNVPFVCYVREDAVSVFQKAKDGYIWKEDLQKEFDQRRLLYTHEVATYTHPVKAWVGMDDGCGRHGNSMLVELPANGASCLTASVSTNGFQLHVSCTTLGGEEALAAELNQMEPLSAFAKLVESRLGWQSVRFFNDDGAVVKHNKPLGNYSRLTMQNPKRTYAHIGMEVYTFTLMEPVVAYYSRMQPQINDHWWFITPGILTPYPVALTRSHAIYMLEKVMVPRELLAAVVTNRGREEWGKSYCAFYDLPETARLQLANVQKIAGRQGD